ncbi:MAG: autotransporter-associated beta strand repeat family protein [Phycisphaerales bacterium]|nr:autotransporter-associated beta strand repeat family protein [Phycisphaerales bacterium]
MRKTNQILALAAMTVLPAAQSLATAYTWSAGTGTQAWSTGWTPAGGPVLAADTATIPPLGGNLAVNLDVTNAILGTLTFGSTGFSTDIGNANSTGNSLTLNNTGGTGNASIITTGTGTNSVTAGLILLGNTDFGAASTTGLTLGSVTVSGGARQLNNNTATTTTPGQTLTLNGTLFTAEVGAVAARGLTINGSGTATTNNGNVIVNGAFNANGVSANFSGVVIGTTSTVNNLVRSTVTLNADNSAFASNITLSRANTVLTSDNNLGTGRLLLGGSTNSIDAFVSSTGGTRTIGSLVTPTQVQIQQFNAFTGTNSFIVNSRVLASASRGMGNLLSGGATLTLNSGFYSANTESDIRHQIIDGSGTTIINGGLHNGYDQTNNIEFAGAAAGSYEKRGTGLLTVNGTSTYLGGTRVRGGSMEFATSAAYGVGAATAGNGITVDAGGTVGLLTSSLDSAFLARIALGGGSNYLIPTLGGAVTTVSTDYTSNGALALTNSDTNTAINYGAGGNLSGTFLQGLGLGAVSTGANYAGTITPAASTYRLGGGGTLTLTNPSSNQLTGGNAVVANNGGTVVLQGTNNYTGSTSIGGTYINPSQELLRLGQTTSVITNNVTLRANSTVSVSSLSDGGVASGIGSASNAASNLVINGGTLQYTGAGSSTDRLMTITANGATLDASGSGAVKFTNTGAIVSGDAAGRAGISDSSSKVVLEVNDVSDLSVGMTVTGTGIAAGTTIKAIVPPSFSNIGGTSSVGPYQIILSAASTTTAGTFVAVPDLVFGGQNRTLTLTGTSTAANALGGSLSNSASGGTLGVTKTGTGTWALGGTNTYTGATTVSAGTLAVSAPSAISSASLVTVGGGATAAAYKIGWNGVSTSATIPLPTLSTNGRFDIGIGRVVLTGTTAAIIQALVGNGSTGSVFTSSADLSHNIGYGDVGSGGITVRYTLLGDANLDGSVNFNDFLVLQNNFNQPGIFVQGDFNYDGVVNFNDFLVLQNNFNQSVSGVAPGVSKAEIAAMTAFASSVPEPTSLAVLGLGAAAMLRRRRA